MEQKPERIYQHVRTVHRVLDRYRGDVPLSRFLTTFFKENRQMGSRDRKMVSRLVYHYFRLGRAAGSLDPGQRLILAEFLCAEDSALVAAESKELYAAMQAIRETGDRTALPSAAAIVGDPAALRAKIAFLEEKTAFRLSDVFPFFGKVSPMIDREAFVRQLFVQPQLFLRVKRGKKQIVTRLLSDHQVPFTEVGPYALALPNRTALEQIAGLHGLVEVQDLSSQRTLDLLEAGNEESWWDACAGAGGKSLLLLDRFPRIRLLVTDSRNSILMNLDARFEAAGIRSYRRKILDLTRDPQALLGNESFDGIILDVPCSGSGTWGRTPEMLTYFGGDQRIEAFVQLQQTIVRHAIPYLKAGKRLVYITCSVFADENEGVVEYMRREQGMELHSMAYLKGYTEGADTLFVAHLSR